MAGERQSPPPALRPSSLPAERGPEWRSGGLAGPGGPGRNLERRMLEPDLRLVGSMLRRRRWIILIGTVSVLAGAAVLTLRWPKTYKSSTTFLAQQQSGHMASPALDVLERLGAVGQIQTEINLLKSRSVVE